MPSAEANEVIQAFTLERANPRFRKGVRIGCLHRSLHDANTRTIEQGIKRLPKLRVAVADQKPSLDVLFLQPHLHIPRLLHHPLLVRMVGGRAHEHLPSLQMNEEQAKRGSRAERSDHVLREEVARDELVHVQTQELPSSRFDRKCTTRIPRRRCQSFFLQDAPNA